MFKYSENYKRIGRLYLIIVIPVLIFIFFISNYFIDIERQNMLELFKQEQAHKSQMINLEIERVINNVVDDLHIIKNSDELTRYINNQTKDNLIELEGIMQRMSNNRDWIDQLRYIDENGNEVVRLNYNFETYTHYLVDKNDLQYKGDRYYVKEIEKLDVDEIYFSPLDLNKENNIIETPIKPIIRMAVPVYDLEKRYKGTIIINYLADNLFDVITTVQGFDEKKTEIAILNSEGYYLYGGEEKNYAFMYEDKQEYLEFPYFIHNLVK